MSEEQHITDELLLDYLLEQCDEEDGARVAAGLESDPQLAARFERLGATLAPLETWTTPPPPANMVSDILDAIVHADALVGKREEKTEPALSSGDDTGGARRVLFSFRDVLAVAACIAVLVGLFGPSMSAVRHRAHRQMCASNLRSLYTGAVQYASANSGYLPYRGRPMVPGIRTPGKPRARNSASLYLLWKGGYVTDPKLAICPGRGDDQPMQAEDIDRLTDFPSLRNRSYNQQFMVRPIRVRIVAKPFVMPYVSDANPVFEGDRFNEQVDPATANSTSHRSRGQNVLFLDGRVGWHKTPIIGLSRDNMWQIGNLRHYSGSEAPTAATDVFMAP